MRSENQFRSGRGRRMDWLKAHFQACLDKPVEVTMIRGDPIYGRLIGFNLDGEVPMIVVETNSCKHFINLRRVERIRVANENRENKNESFNAFI